MKRKKLIILVLICSITGIKLLTGLLCTDGLHCLSNTRTQTADMGKSHMNAAGMHDMNERQGCNTTTHNTRELQCPHCFLEKTLDFHLLCDQSYSITGSLYISTMSFFTAAMQDVGRRLSPHVCSNTPLIFISTTRLLC